MKNVNIPLFFLLLACVLATANAEPIGTGDPLPKAAAIIPTAKDMTPLSMSGIGLLPLRSGRHREISKLVPPALKA